MVFIKNTQRKYPLDCKALTQLVQTVLEEVGYPHFDVNIWLTTNGTIKKYNKQFRHKDSATDVLSFCYYENISPKTKIKPKKDEEKVLGDILISIEYAFDTAKKSQVSGPERLKELVVHGICHLIGYDHETDSQYVQMHKKELQLLRKVKKIQI